MSNTEVDAEWTHRHKILVSHVCFGEDYDFCQADKAYEHEAIR